MCKRWQQKQQTFNNNKKQELQQNDMNKILNNSNNKNIWRSRTSRSDEDEKRIFFHYFSLRKFKCFVALGIANNNNNNNKGNNCWLVGWVVWAKTEVIENICVARW